MKRMMTDAELRFALTDAAAGKWLYCVYVDESKTGGICYTVPADNATHARFVAREHALRIRGMRKARIVGITRHVR